MILVEIAGTVRAQIHPTVVDPTGEGEVPVTWMV